MAYINYTLPSAGVHPRIWISDANGPSLSSVRSRAFGERQSEFNSLLSFCQGRVGDSESTFVNRPGEYAGAFAFAWLMSNSYGSFGEKAIDIAEYLANNLPSSEYARRYAVESLALVYDWCYDLMNDSERSTIRDGIDNVVDGWKSPDAAEKFWGHSHGNFLHALYPLIAIMEDDPTYNSTWQTWMEDMLDDLWDGQDEGHSFWAVFRHWGNDDGGSHKGIGNYSYFTQNEGWYNHVIPALASGLAVSVETYAPWWFKSCDWALWHQRGDRQFHKQCEGQYAPDIRYHTNTQVHLMQAIQRYLGRQNVDGWMWLQNEIEEAHDAFGSEVYTTWGPYLIHDILYREPLSYNHPTTEEQMKVFRNARKVVFRTGWDWFDLGTTSTSMTISAGRFTGGHIKPAQEVGHFELCIKGDPIFISQGHYDGSQTTTYKVKDDFEDKTGHRYTYCKNACASSIGIIYDSNEPSENKIESFQVLFDSDYFMGVRDGAVDTVSNQGGPLWPKDTVNSIYQPKDMDHFVSESKWNHETFAIEPVSNPTHNYVVLQLTNKYYSAKQTRYKRHFVWIKPGAINSDWQEPIIIIWDDMVTHTDAKGNRTNGIFLQTSQISDAGSTGTNFSYTGNNGRALVRVLQPSSVETRDITGFYDLDAVGYWPTYTRKFNDSSIGPYRREIYPASATTEPSFLTVIMPCGATVDPSTAPQVSALSKTGYVGVVFPNDNLQLEIATGDTHSAALASTTPEPPPPPQVNDKRRSLQCLGMWLPWMPIVFPDADSSIDDADHEHVAGLYRGIQAEDWTPPPPPEEPTPPAAPTGLVATAGDGQVALDWDDNIELDLDHYIVYRQQKLEDGTYSIWDNVQAPTVSSWTDTTVTNGTTYRYQVTAVDADLEESEPSENSGDVTPQTEPPTPPPEEPEGRSISDADETPEGVPGRTVEDAEDDPTKTGRSISEADETPTPVEDGQSVGDQT